MATASSPRASASGDPGSSFACAASSASPAMLDAGFPSSLDTNASENSRIASGVMTPWTLPPSISVSWNCSNCARLSGSVKSSSTVCPSSIETTVSIACPPKSSW